MTSEAEAKVVERVQSRKTAPLLPRGRPRAYRSALRMSWALTTLSVGLAIGPAFVGESRYDPALAVLTVTLIALIWYTFFSFVAAFGEPASIVLAELRRAGHNVEPVLRNASRRNVWASLFLRVWVDGEERHRQRFFRGRPRFLGAEERLVESVPVIDEDDINRTPARHEPRFNEILVMMRVIWVDDNEDLGDTGPRYYRLPHSRIHQLLVDEDVRGAFPRGAGLVKMKCPVADDEPEPYEAG